MNPFPLAALMLVVWAASPSDAQSTNGQNTGSAASGFVARFRQGCLGSDKEASSPSRQRYCGCLLDAYQQRYSESELTAITQLASQAGTAGPAVVNAMMSPERRRCAQP